MSTLNDTREQVDLQKAAVESLVGRISEQEATLTSLASDAEAARQRIEVLHQASSDLSLLIAKIAWLQAETKNEFGTDRAKTAIDQIVRELNRIVEVVISDPGKRSRWIQELQQSLPPRS